PNTNTGVEGVAAVAGVALLATGAVVVAKKRK
ncbi:MAG: NPXTG-anchored protein, partial [Ruminiclostridium sp.]|nr:NPXTG-anchored protein [Ruminiclostridium sp.]